MRMNVLLCFLLYWAKSDAGLVAPPFCRSLGLRLPPHMRWGLMWEEHNRVYACSWTVRIKLMQHLVRPWTTGELPRIW